jgi:hypothetical protein
MGDHMKQEGNIFWSTLGVWVAIVLILSFTTTNDAVWWAALAIVSITGIWKLSKFIGPKNRWKAFYLSALLFTCLVLIMGASIAYAEGDIVALSMIGLVVVAYVVGGTLGFFLARR